MPDNITNSEDIEVVDPALATDQDMDDEEPYFAQEDPAEPAVETPAEEEAAAAPASSQVVSHPPELIERATALQIPADEVAAMTPEQLRQVIKHADRVGRTVYDSLTQKPAEAPVVEKPAPAKPVDDLAVLDDPEKYDQAFVAPIKAVLSKQAEENRVLRERLEKLEKVQASSHQQTLHQRLVAKAAEVSPEVAKAFDLGTPTGQAKYAELLDQMGASHRHNKTLTEEQLLRRAIKAMDLIPEAPKEAPEVEAGKRRWDANALAKPTVRKAVMTAEDRVGEILAAKKASKPVNGTSGK